MRACFLHEAFDNLLNFNFIMGQRHQAFMVACIVPYGMQTARYRCIGALHQQWCYGSLPLLADLRFLTLIKQPENLEVIREEMRALDGLYGCWLQEPKLPQVPCPFTQFLLGSAWSVDLDDPVDAYSAQVLNLWADMGPKDGGLHYPGLFKHTYLSAL